MKLYKFKIIGLIMTMLLYRTVIHSQITSFNSSQTNQIYITFLKDKIEAEAQTSVFNILTIKNYSDFKYEGKLNISLPRGWSLFGESTTEINIEPNDSLNIPVRVSIPGNVVSEVGYSVVATIVDMSGRNVKSAYSYVTIKRYTNFKVKQEKLFYYISNIEKKTDFAFNILNDGNVDELVHIEMLTSNNLSINNEFIEPVTKEYSLQPKKDSTLSFQVFYNEDDIDELFSQIKITTSTVDTSFNQTLWFKILTNYYALDIPEKSKCGILEFNIHNLFGTEEPSYSLFFKGSVLFKKNRELYYYFRSLNFSNSNPFVEHLDKSKYYIGYKSSYYDFKFGSIEKRLQQNLYGVGVDATFKLKQNKLNLIYSQDIYGNTESYAGDLAFSIQNIGLNMGAVHSEDITHSINNDVVYFGSNFNLFKKSNISFTVGANRVNDSIVGLTEGYGFSFNYKLNLKKFYFAIQTVLGSPYYVGVYRGQYNIKADAEYKISKISKIYAQYNRLVYNYSNSEIFVFHRNIEKYQLYFSKLFNNVNFQIGNYTYLYATDQLDPTDADLFYKSYSSHMFTSLNIIANRKISFNPRLELGQVRVLEPSSVDPSKNKPYSTFKISVNVTAKNYGLYTFFQNGPFNLFEQMYYFQNNFFTKWFYLMPYYKTTFLNKTVHLDVRANYINNIVTNENIFSLNTQLQWFLPRDFSIRLFNSISSRNRYDVGTNTKYNYSNTYFEVGIRKEFNCNQPRIQYYNLKVVFFRDLNGSRKKESNEPGISNIMVEIKKDFKKDDLDSYNEFVDAQLLTDYSGTVEYENIPNGFYNINYQLLAKITGNYSLEQLEAEVLMDEDKIIYIPYMENNKIIGKVVLNRNPLSSLGEMDISNIRVIAEDTQGHSYSALTDKQGNFILYTPVADHYIVKINNIFYESFDLQQPEFIVKFNGYKQFEVQFVFDEKKRKINFENDVNTDDLKLEDLKVIQKTTLTGKIRDAISLEPIEASVKIVDNKTNVVISNTISNKMNGNYAISYVAGDHFRIEINAPGYNIHVENLYIEQVISIQNISKDLMLSKPSSGAEDKTFILYNEKEEQEFTENFKPGQKIPMNNLNFDEKETRLSPNAYPELDRLIDILNKNKNVTIEIAGHADDSGKDRIDKILAMRRAKAVEKYLTMHGLSKDRVESKSYSNRRPIVPGKSEKAKKKNRRVEIIVK